MDCQAGELGRVSAESSVGRKEDSGRLRDPARQEQNTYGSFPLLFLISMRILAVIPHDFDATAEHASDGRRHGSLGKDPAPRGEALAALHQQFNPSQSIIDIAR